MFLFQAVKYQGFTLDELLPDSGTLHLMMMHPLAVQVTGFHREVFVFGVWGSGSRFFFGPLDILGWGNWFPANQERYSI